MKKSEEKTNVMRVLSQHKIEYKSHYYGDSDAIAGMDVATQMGEDPNRVFKTLVLVGHSKTYYVCMVPVTSELSLKKAAAAFGEKSIEMIKAKELLPLTGYVHGGCSPIGMKKTFKTIIHETAKDFDTIFFSGGKIGYQVEMPADEIGKIVKFEYANIIE